ncbi:hypothetical protein TNCT_336041 [Trichonephila clavata]|uniref:Uncharacterized protein n=1 Tax=Trichonephila clavata TaxID=2740835 RepID=A0A8X6JH06_TRICU|nr:hypothetical protein TNCT_336041 [Trichonephila clavata]
MPQLCTSAHFTSPSLYNRSSLPPLTDQKGFFRQQEISTLAGYTAALSQTQGGGSFHDPIACKEHSSLFPFLRSSLPLDG